MWLTVGLSPRSARSLVEAGYRSLADLEGVTRDQLLDLRDVGGCTIEILEELLGRPLGDAPAALSESRAFPEKVWRRRGVPHEAAITFAIEEMTLERLRSLTREELLALPRVGPATVRACERLLGRKMPSNQAGDAGEAYWLDRGMTPKISRRLSRAGIKSVTDLRNQTREDLLALPGVGEGGLGRLEAILGQELPSRSAYWRGLGLSAQLANVLLRHRIKTLEDLGRLTREQFLYLPGLGISALLQCERLLGRRLERER